MDDAGAALGGVAADMGAGEPQILAQELHQQRAGSTSAVTALPFTVMETAGMTFLLKIGAKGPFFAPDSRRPAANRCEIVPIFAEFASLEQEQSEPGRPAVKGSFTAQ